MKNFSKSMFGAVAAVAVIGANLAPVAEVSAWGDNNSGRTGYTIAEIENGALGDNVVMNSIKDGEYTDADGKVHNLGDERNFVRTRLSGTSNVWSSNEITAEDGKEYVLSLYVHNNNPQGEKVVAKDVTVSYSIPGNSATSIEVNGFITASNATPNEYWDNVVFKSANGSNFHLEYIDGSALWESNGKSAGKLSDDIITANGVKVGYDSLNGEIPGCYQYSGYASVHVKAVYEEAFTISKQVRIKGTTEWKETVDAKIGDTVEYMIGYKNTSGATVNNVMVLDSLPTNIEYVAGSTKLKNANHPNADTLSDGITTKGVNIGSYANGANAYILFEGKVVDNTLACGNNKLINWVKITAGSVTRRDDASVMTVKDGDICKEEPEIPDEPTPDEPEIPEEPETPEEPEVPGELPNTGAGSIVTGALGIGSMVTALGYFVASRKKLM